MKISIYINKRILTKDYEVININKNLVLILLRLKIEGRNIETVIYSIYSPPPELYLVREIPKELT